MKNPGDAALASISGGEVQIGKNNFRFEQAYDPDSTNAQVSRLPFSIASNDCTHQLASSINLPNLPKPGKYYFGI